MPKTTLPKTTLWSCLALILFLLPVLTSGGIQLRGSDPPAPVSLRIGVQLLWTTEGVECIAGCNGVLEPIRLGSGIEWDVAVDNFDFTPQVLDIALGDSVTWTNTNGIHNVEADDGSFRCAEGCDGDGGNGDPAPEPWVVTLTFLDAAAIPYFCELHGAAGGIGMSGVINVIDTVIFADGFESGDTGEWSSVVD